MPQGAFEWPLLNTDHVVVNFGTATDELSTSEISKHTFQQLTHKIISETKLSHDVWQGIFSYFNPTEPDDLRSLNALRQTCRLFDQMFRSIYVSDEACMQFLVWRLYFNGVPSFPSLRYDDVSKPDAKKCEAYLLLLKLSTDQTTMLLSKLVAMALSHRFSLDNDVFAHDYRSGVVSDETKKADKEREMLYDQFATVTSVQQPDYLQGQSFFCIKKLPKGVLCKFFMCLFWLCLVRVFNIFNLVVLIPSLLVSSAFISRQSLVFFKHARNSRDKFFLPTEETVVKKIKKSFLTNKSPQ